MSDSVYYRDAHLSGVSGGNRPCGRCGPDGSNGDWTDRGHRAAGRCGARLSLLCGRGRSRRRRIGGTAQRIGVEALKVWNAKRYDTLDVTNGGSIVNDALSYDIFAAVARIVRAPEGAKVLGGIKPERVFATGHSQSAARLATYVN